MSLLSPFLNDLGFTLRPSISRRRHRELWPTSRRRRTFRHPLRRIFSLDDDLWDLENQMESMQDEIERTFEDFGLTPFTTLALTDQTRPRQTQGRLALRGTEGELASNASVPSEEVNESQDKYVVSFPLGDVPAENLKISVKDRVVTIDVKKEEKSEDGTCRLYQEYTRKFTLPEHVQAKDVKSVLTPEGVLKLEAPIPQPQLEAPKESRNIPIQVESVQ